MDYIALKPIRLDKQYSIGDTIPSTAIDPMMVKRLTNWGKISPSIASDTGSDGDEAEKALEAIAREQAELEKGKKALASDVAKHEKAKKASEKAIETAKAEAEALKAEAEKLMEEATAKMEQVEAAKEGEKTGVEEGEQTALPDTPPDKEKDSDEPPVED